MLSSSTKTRLTETRAQIESHFTSELIPFWLHHSIDHDYGGYLLNTDEDGHALENHTDKFLVTQARMVWSFAMFSRYFPAEAAYKDAARQGVDFLIRHFWDEKHGGWFAHTTREGTCRRDDKMIYAQGFALYGLAEYYRATGDPRGLEYAGRTFDLLQRNAADVLRGGYYEYMGADWSLQHGREFTDTYKSINTHMHLMEAYTTLYQTSGDPIHARRLGELTDLILKFMIHPAGSAYDWFDLAFTPIPSSPFAPVNIDPAQPIFVTSYGHNIELSWFFIRACEALGQPRDTHLNVIRGLVNHALDAGYDCEHGGVYYFGEHAGVPLLPVKEWWPQAEAMIGFIMLYDITREERYLEAFRQTWDFVNQHVINHAVGEWRATCAADGTLIRGTLADPWKGAYHTGRAMAECLDMIDKILAEE